MYVMYNVGSKLYFLTYTVFYQKQTKQPNQILKYRNKSKIYDQQF